MFLKQFQGVRSRASDACASNNPCQNGGKCIATDNGPLCDCGKVDFSGIFCQQGKSKLLTKLQYILHTILRLFNIVVCRIDFQFQVDWGLSFPSLAIFIDFHHKYLLTLLGSARRDALPARDRCARLAFENIGWQNLFKASYFRAISGFSILILCIKIMRWCDIKYV